jgi:hypothetical protein
LSALTVCCVLSLLVHVTVVPAFTLMGLGLKAKSLMIGAVAEPADVAVGLPEPPQPTRTTPRSTQRSCRVIGSLGRQGWLSAHPREQVVLGHRGRHLAAGEQEVVHRVDPVPDLRR